MKAFSYERARSVDDALAAVRDGARALAGGTDLLTLMQADLFAPARLVDIKRALDADISSTPEGGMRIGALAPLSAVEHDSSISTRYTALAESARLAATPQLRNMATIAGNLLQRPRCWYFRNPRVSCWLKGGDACPAREGENRNHALFSSGPCVAVHPSDPAAALVALGARVRVKGFQGDRTIGIEDFLLEPEDGRRTETILAEDELILSIELPPAAGLRSTYLKAMDRKAWAFALVGVAAARTGERVRIVLSGVAPVPWQVEAHAIDDALRAAEPLAQNAFKVDLARALIARALDRIA